MRYESQKASLPLIIVKGDGASLLGRNWLHHIRLNWESINLLEKEKGVEELIDRHPGLFRSELGTLKGVEAKIFVPPNAQTTPSCLCSQTQSRTRA